MKELNRKLVVWDIHGWYRSFKQCLERSKFDYDNDQLICLGDIVDGWPETPEVVEELLKIKNLVLIEGNHDCLSFDTECLTKRWWMKFNEIKKDDIILSINTSTWLWEWTVINDIIIKKAPKEINTIKTQKIDLACTDNHRVLCNIRNKWKEFWDYEYINFNNLKWRIKIPTTTICNNDWVSLSNDELMFIAWMLTDWCIIKKWKYIWYNIYQSKEKWINNIHSLLKRLWYEYSFNKRNQKVDSIWWKKTLFDNYDSWVFHILKNSSKIIREYFSSKYPFPEYLFNMNKRQFDLFIETIIMWDWSWSTNWLKRSCVLYWNKLFLDNIQILCIMNWYSANITQSNMWDFRLNISMSQSEQMDVVYKKSKEKYLWDIVWCLSVPNTNFMVRRNWKAFFTWNSWAREWFKFGSRPIIWTQQGWQATIDAYLRNTELLVAHRDFLDIAVKCYVDDDRLFVHWGFKLGSRAEEQPLRYLSWDRDLYDMRNNDLDISPYREVYVGHTSTWNISKIPFQRNNVWFLDQWGGYEGRLSIMDIDTKEFWQSDRVNLLYPWYHWR